LLAFGTDCPQEKSANDKMSIACISLRICGNLNILPDVHPLDYLIIGFRATKLDQFIANASINEAFSGYKYLLPILLLGPLTASAQNKWTDSVKTALARQKEDTNKVNTLLALSDSYQLNIPIRGLPTHNGPWPLPKSCISIRGLLGGDHLQP